MERGLGTSVKICAGRVALERHLDLLGIRGIHSRPYHPQTCGKVERFHQTLKKWLRAQDPAETLAQLQTQLDDFLIIYNQQRPPAPASSCSSTTGTSASSPSRANCYAN